MESQDVEYKVIEPTASGAKRRGRRPNAEILSEKNEQEIAEIEAEDALQRRLSVIDERFGDGQLYDRTRIEVEVRAHMQNSAASYLQAGYRLIQLKEHEPHGSFLESLKHIGLGEDVVQKMMLTARKLQGTKIANADTDRYLLPTKLYEIALLDEDQIEDLDTGGAVGPITLDDISRMTARDVRQALRDERQKRKEEIEARERVIKEKNDKLDELDRELRGLPPKSQKEVNEERLRELQFRFVGRAMEICSLMTDLQGVLDEAARLPDVDALQLAPFQDEIVRLGTENIAEEWESLCAVLEDYRPIREETNVPKLG